MLPKKFDLGKISAYLCIVHHHMSASNEHSYITPDILEHLEVLDARSLPRDAVTGAVSFDFILESGETYDTTECFILRYDILRFIDSSGTHLVNPTVRSKVADWKNTAIAFPNKKRHCIFCDTRVYHGKLACGHCVPNTNTILDNLE